MIGIAVLIVVVVVAMKEIPKAEGFQNGVNQAWVRYGNDFGNAPPEWVSGEYEKTFAGIVESGGNTARIWVHCGGEQTPIFDEKRNVIATDRNGTLVEDIWRMVKSAEKMGVTSVWLSLWNLAVPPSSALYSLFFQPLSLPSYFRIVLIPLLQRLSSISSFVGIEIINEVCFILFYFYFIIIF